MVLRAGPVLVPLVSVRRHLQGGEGVSLCGVGPPVMSHMRFSSFCAAWRGSHRRLTTYGWSWGAGSWQGLDCMGMERTGRPGFPCVLQHPSARWPEPTVHHRLPAGRLDQALEGGLCPGPLLQLPQLRVGPALPAQFVGGSLALGVGVGVGVCGGVVGTGGRGGPGGVLVVLRLGGTRGVEGASVYADTGTCGYRI